MGTNNEKKERKTAKKMERRYHRNREPLLAKEGKK
jgi:hypothetical protein